MADIEVRPGLVSDVGNNGAGITFKFGDPPIMLSIGAIPSRVAAGTLVPTAVDPGDYIVVAVCKSLLQPLNHVLLAYRRPRCEVHAANFTLAAWGVVAGIAGVAASVAIPVPAAVRLLSIRTAKRLLGQWHEPA